MRKSGRVGRTVKNGIRIEQPQITIKLVILEMRSRNFETNGRNLPVFGRHLDHLKITNIQS